MQIIGVEEKDLAHEQYELRYNTDREHHVAQQLTELRQHGQYRQWGTHIFKGAN